MTSRGHCCPWHPPKTSAQTTVFPARHTTWIWPEPLVRLVVAVGKGNTGISWAEKRSLPPSIPLIPGKETGKAQTLGPSQCLG